MTPFFRIFLVILACLAGVFLCSEKANAAEGWGPDVVGIHVGSYHVEKYDPTARQPWNNHNPGLYGRWNDIVVGTYYNSIRRQSVYVGYVYPLTSYADVVVGAVTGYNGPGYSAKAVMPMVVLSVHFPITNGIEGRVHVIPKVAKGGATAVHFSVEWRL